MLSNSSYKTNQIHCILIIMIIIAFCILINNKINTNFFSNSFINIVNKYHYSTSPKYLLDKCQWKYDHYSPSSWELYWYNNITILQNQVCSILKQKDQMNKSITALEYIINLQKTIFKPSIKLNKSDELLSKMFYRYECSDSTTKSNLIISQSIEPFIGLLRDPLTICSIQGIPSHLQLTEIEAIHSRRFFLLGPSAPYQNYQTSTPSIAPWLYKQGSQKILFDIGSSYFNDMFKATVTSSIVGTRWFYDYFRTKGLNFDRIIAFEGTQYNPKDYWNQIPEDIMGLLTFINMGVEKTGKFNPWNILKTVAKKEDYVIIKLDIDTPALELELCNQIVNDTSIYSLIDEMVFEMHVSINEMKIYWGVLPNELKDTYILFRKLRELGIRMHSWP